MGDRSFVKQHSKWPTDVVAVLLLAVAALLFTRIGSGDSSSSGSARAAQSAPEPSATKSTSVVQTKLDQLQQRITEIQTQLGDISRRIRTLEEKPPAPSGPQGQAGQTSKPQETSEARLRSLERSVWIWGFAPSVLVAVLLGLGAYYLLLRPIIRTLSAMMSQLSPLSQRVAEVESRLQGMQIHEDRGSFRLRTRTGPERETPAALEPKDLLMASQTIASELGKIYGVLQAIRGEIVNPSGGRNNEVTGRSPGAEGIAMTREQREVDAFIKDYNLSWERQEARFRFRETYHPKRLAMPPETTGGGAAPGHGAVITYIESNYGKIEVCKVGESWLIVPAFEEPATEPSIRQAFRTVDADTLGPEASHRKVRLIEPARASQTASGAWQLESQGTLTVSSLTIS